MPSPATSPRNNNQGKGKGKGKGKGGFQNQQWGQNNFNNGGNWKGGHQNHFQHNQVPFNGFHNHHHNFQGWNQGFQPNYFQPGFQNQWVKLLLCHLKIISKVFTHITIGIKITTNLMVKVRVREISLTLLTILEGVRGNITLKIHPQQIHLIRLGAQHPLPQCEVAPGA